MANENEIKMDETLEGTVLFNVPFPKKLDEEGLAFLKKMSPIIVKYPYQVNYVHSYGQDSPFFAGLANRVFLGCRDSETGYTYANPRGHDMYTGSENEWVEIVPMGKIHAFTVCYFGSEAFLPECPFILILVEFEQCDTLFLARLVGVDPDGASLDWIGKKVKGRFLRNSKLKPTDIYFNLMDEKK